MSMNIVFASLLGLVIGFFVFILVTSSAMGRTINKLDAAGTARVWPQKAGYLVHWIDTLTNRTLVTELRQELKGAL